jgi:pSer/pThr/pTyr-binding forkhead associated (FHA) protein
VFEPKSKRVLIGRLNDCDIKIEDTNLSRYQAEFIYRDRWLLNDGCAGKRSTNGTWLLVESPYPIENET